MPPSPFSLAPSLREGRFLRRLNRFVVEADLEGRAIRAHLPNPGRLLELLVVELAQEARRG